MIVLPPILVITTTRPASTPAPQMEDAILFLSRARAQVEPCHFQEFLDVLEDFEAKEINTECVILWALHLFGRNRALIFEFLSFVPEGYAVELPEAVCGPAYPTE
jgi:histone deacetylase complex regulatory component SIN3